MWGLSALPERAPAPLQRHVLAGMLNELMLQLKTVHLGLNFWRALPSWKPFNWPVADQLG